jgi:quercetin dioxygenase-like cupin family protein
MNPRRAAVVLSVLAAARLTAQVQEPVPVEREPQHRQVFENAALRVLDVNLPPGYVSLFHTHSNDNISVRILTGPTRVDLPDANGEVQVPAIGRVVFNGAVPPYTHRVVNAGTTPIRIIDLEILSPRDATSTATLGREPSPQHTMVVDNARAHVDRVTVAAGTTLPAHAHRRAWLEVVVTGPNAGRFTWHESGARAAAVTAPSSSDVEFVEVEVP